MFSYCANHYLTATGIRQDAIAFLASLVLLIVAILPCGAYAGQQVRVGIYQNAPKIFVDKDGNPSGFFPELLNEIATREGWNLSYTPCEWNQCLQLLERGEIDLMPDVAFSAPRALQYRFGKEEVIPSWSTVYVRKNSPIQAIPDLDNKRLAVVKGSVQAQELSDMLPQFGVETEFVSVPDFEAGFREVANGQVDGVSSNRYFGDRRAVELGLKATAILHGPSLLYFAESPQGDPALLDAIDRQLKGMKRNGQSVYHALLYKWLLPESKHTVPPWARWALIAAVVLIPLLMIVIILFRKTVRLRTRELLTKKEELEFLSYFDALTGLPNRMLFLDRLGHAVRHRGDGKRGTALLFIDLDNFKEINDSRGHETGDEVLNSIAMRFAKLIRRGDTLARLGGDEFTVLLEDVDAERAAVVAEKLLASFDRPVKVRDAHYYLSASIGIVLAGDSGPDGQELLRNADAAMYLAKSSGRNTYRFYSEELTRQSQQRIELLTSLRAALENHELSVYYQPLFDLASDRITGVEALVRWNRSGKLIPPCDFLPVAEQGHLIQGIDDFVMRRACEQMVRWKTAGADIGRVSVNLSGQRLQQQGLLAAIERILEDTDCRAEWVEFEISEGFAMKSPEESISLMQALRDKGMHIAIDDFGTGYSSLAYLKKLPISRLKIDRSFVSDTPDDKDDVAIVRAVIALGQSLGLSVLAEGIETVAQRQFLFQEGCNEGQGYLRGRPMPADELSRLLGLSD